MLNKYIVVFLDDSGKMYIKNKIFTSLLDADNYVEAIDKSRNPTILPYIPMNPKGKGDEFTCDDHDELAGLVADVKDLFLWSYDEAGTVPLAVCHVMNSLSHLEIVIQDLRMASLVQARETK